MDLIQNLDPQLLMSLDGQEVISTGPTLVRPGARAAALTPPSSICILDFDLVSADHFLRREGSMHNTVFYQLSAARHPLITLGLFMSLSKCIRHP